jgi:hypothetical protein
VDLRPIGEVSFAGDVPLSFADEDRDMDCADRGFDDFPILAEEDFGIRMGMETDITDMKCRNDRADICWGWVAVPGR